MIIFSMILLCVMLWISFAVALVDLYNDVME
jgi:hypothetical protein